MHFYIYEYTVRPLTPTNFTLDNYSYSQVYQEANASLTWKPPQENSKVDNYTLIITPAPLIGKQVITTSLLRWGTIFIRDQLYTAILSAINCGGQSDSAYLSNFVFGFSNSKCSIGVILLKHEHIDSVVTYLGDTIIRVANLLRVMVFRRNYLKCSM